MDNSPALQKSDFLQSTFGKYRSRSWRSRRIGLLTDFLFNVRLALNPNYWKVFSRAKHSPVRNILLIGVEVPSRADDLKTVMNALSKTRHHVTTCHAHLENGRGKFQNINTAMANLDANSFDWIIVVDDDIKFGNDFLDKFIYLAESLNLDLCQPAHKFHSYLSFEITQRCWNSLARETHFVECGPFTAFNRKIFPDILPFPDLRWAWGTDIAWSELARNKFKIGIIDATPIRHSRLVAKSYDMHPASEECNEFLDRRGITRPRQEILKTVEVINTL